VVGRAAQEVPAPGLARRSGATRRIKAVLVLTAVAATSSAGLSAPTLWAAGGGNGKTPNLHRQKLQEEVRQLKLSNDHSSGVEGFFATFAAPLTALAAVGGILLSLRAQRQEQGRQRQQREDDSVRHVEEQARQRDERQAESQRRLDERFAEILVELGSDSEATQAGAAASLLGFLSDENRQFRHQVRLASLANLKIEHTEQIRGLLLKVFEEGMRTEESYDAVELDLSRAQLQGAQLEALDLTGADLKATDLTKANLVDAKLANAHGSGVQLKDAKLLGPECSLKNARLPEAQAVRARFSGANLNNAHLERSDLRGAEFKGTRLQAAHLDDAKLQGAKFDGADVNDTYLRGAEFDEAALRSLRRAQNWERAHLSKDEEERLRALTVAPPGKP
jgi:uncharacterized protein YjbI with pentapeptide repeats